MPKTPFPCSWKGENGLYAVGFTRRGLLGTSSDAVKVAKDISDQWKKINNSKYSAKELKLEILGKIRENLDREGTC